MLRPVQAYDCEAMREVAVKIHQLNSAWAESKKASYVRHAVREYNIHKGLRHARIVALLDIFEVDVNTFATVLELCRGHDLDSHLKDHQVGPTVSITCAGIQHSPRNLTAVLEWDSHSNDVRQISRPWTPWFPHFLQYWSRALTVGQALLKGGSSLTPWLPEWCPGQRNRDQNG